MSFDALGSRLAAAASAALTFAMDNDDIGVDPPSVSMTASSVGIRFVQESSLVGSMMRGVTTDVGKMIYQDLRAKSLKRGLTLFLLKHGSII